MGVERRIILVSRQKEFNFQHMMCSLLRNEKKDMEKALGSHTFECQRRGRNVCHNTKATAPNPSRRFGSIFKQAQHSQVQVHEQRRGSDVCVAERFLTPAK